MWQAVRKVSGARHEVCKLSTYPSVNVQLPLRWNDTRETTNVRMLGRTIIGAPVFRMLPRIAPPRCKHRDTRAMHSACAQRVADRLTQRARVHCAVCRSVP